MRYLFYPGWAVAPEYYRSLHYFTDAEPEVADYGFFNPGATFDLRSIQALGARTAEKTVILAHSMGSMFALRAAAINPNVAALILFSPFARFSEAEGYSGQPLRNIKAMRMQLRRDAKGLLESFYSAVSNPEIIGFDPEPAINIAALDEGLNCLMEYDVREMLSEVKCPVLMIQGGMDHISGNGQADYLSSRLTGGVMKIITDAGHALPFSRSDECREIIGSFLTQCLER